MIRVLLIDNHPAIRAGLLAALKKADGLTVVGEAADGLAGLKMIEELRPDVVLLDCRLPGMDGIKVAETVRQRKLRTHIVALSAYVDDQYVHGMLQAGAAGYVLKDEDLDTVITALRAVAGGQEWFSQAVVAKVMAWAREGGSAPAQPGMAELSERELQVLRLLARGWDNQRIADELVITEGTVKNHLSNIYAKLNARSRGEAVALAWKLGIVDS